MQHSASARSATHSCPLLDLAEVPYMWPLLASYLQRRDLIAMMLVCKRLRAFILPSVSLCVREADLKPHNPSKLNPSAFSSDFFSNRRSLIFRERYYSKRRCAFVASHAPYLSALHIDMESFVLLNLVSLPRLTALSLSFAAMPLSLEGLSALSSLHSFCISLFGKPNVDVFYAVGSVRSLTRLHLLGLQGTFVDSDSEDMPDIPPIDLRPLSALTGLHLLHLAGSMFSNNRLTLPRLTALTALKLESATITVHEVSAYASSLVTLSLSKTEFHGKRLREALCELLPLCTRLCNLKISQQSMRGLADALLVTTSDLICLSLVHTNEKKELSRPFARFSKLRWLDLNSESFSPWDIHPPGGFPALSTLRIAEYDSYMVEDVLAQLSSLRELHITTPNVHEVNQRALQKLVHVRITTGESVAAFEAHVGIRWPHSM